MTLLHCFVESEVKRKLNILRTYFTRELAKSLGQRDDGTDEPYVSRWPHFDSMMFLSESITQRKRAKVVCINHDPSFAHQSSIGFYQKTLPHGSPIKQEDFRADQHR